MMWWAMIIGDAVGLVSAAALGWLYRDAQIRSFVEDLFRGEE